MTHCDDTDVLMLLLAVLLEDAFEEKKRLQD